MCHHSALVLLDPSSTYSYVSAYFIFDIDIMYEKLVDSICVSSLIGESLVMNWLYRGCVVTFMGKDTLVDLILLNMVNFDVILGRDWLLPYHVILEYHAKTVTISCPYLH